MKILFYRFKNLCEPDILDAFRELGVDVAEMEAVPETDLRGSLVSAIAVKTLSARLLQTPADAVFSVNFFPSVAEVCNIFHIPYLSWIVTAPVMQLYAPSVALGCNRIFTFDRAMAEEISSFNPGHVFHLPMAAPVKRVQDALKKRNDETPSAKTCYDISFIGSLYTEKNSFGNTDSLPDHTRGFIDALIEAQRFIYGYDLISDTTPDDIITDYKTHHRSFYAIPGDSFLNDRVTFSQLYAASEVTVRDRQHALAALSANLPVDLWTFEKPETLPDIRFHGTAETLYEMPAIFAASKINLNPTARAIRTGIPLRVFDILAAGGFCLTNYQSELADLFETGVHLDCYGSTDELIEKCEYYLSHETERAGIARAGLELVIEHHTYEHRLSYMLQPDGTAD